MKQGATYNIPINLPLKKDYTLATFTLKSESETVSKKLSTDEGGVFIIPLTQQDTMKLKGVVKVEVQVDYTDNSVWKNDDYMTFYMKETLANHFVDNNAPSDDDGIDLAIDIIKEGLAAVITPEASQELLEAVTEIFNDTKSVADSVREDADNGVFDGRDGTDGRDGRDGTDGEDGFSPEITVAEDTGQSYKLNIKTEDDEFETENLKGTYIEPEWEQLATVNVADLEETPDGFVWDIANYDDVMIEALGLTAVTGTRNFVYRLTTTGGNTSYQAVCPSKITQTARNFFAKIDRLFGNTKAMVEGSCQDNSYPYEDRATSKNIISMPEGKITKVELIIGNGGGLATGNITLYGRKRG